MELKKPRDLLVLMTSSIETPWTVEKSTVEMAYKSIAAGHSGEMNGEGIPNQDSNSLPLVEAADSGVFEGYRGGPKGL
jgi:hypothetical protein